MPGRRSTTILLPLDLLAFGIARCRAWAGSTLFLGQTTTVSVEVLPCIKYILCRSTTGTTPCTATKIVCIDQGVCCKVDPGLPYLAAVQSTHPVRFSKEKKTVHGMGAEKGCG